MPDTPNRVALDRVDWLRVLPVLRLASAFRHALQPGKLLVALGAVLVLHAAGLLMDAVWSTDSDSPYTDAGVYHTLLSQQTAAFSGLVGSALQCKLGLAGDEFGIGDALHRMFIHIPTQAFDHHPWFMLILGLIAIAVLCPASGVICRMTATQLCVDQGTSLLRAVRFVKRRWLWYVLTPLMPTLLILLIAGVLIALGFVFFNLPGLDAIGSLLYGLLLLLGLVIAIVTILLIFAANLMAPALSVEGTDGFDAIARSFNYVMFRPWQFAGYFLSAILYAAVVYVLIVSIAGLTLKATHTFTGIGAFTELDEPTDVDGMTRYDTITAPPRPFFDDDGFTPMYPADISDSSSINISGWIIRRWYELCIALIVALMFSVVCCLQTQVYVLLRRSADGTPLDDCAADGEQDPWSSPADMVDPKAQAIAAAGPGDSPVIANEPDKPTAEE